MELPSLEAFALVGGTALSLRYGHRSSIDLDLFVHEQFDPQLVEEELQNVFHNDLIYESGKKSIGIFCYIKHIKVDIVSYPHALISNMETISGIRMYGDPDIAAMKVQAILGRGKKKDFYDLAELLEHYSLDQIMHWHKRKYPNQMLAISIPQAVTYFDDADESEEPLSLKGQSWEQVKDFISAKVRDFLR